jgi:hypothetical protein
MAAARWQREGDGQVDESYIDEWVEFGWNELVAYLAKWAAFWRWCVKNDREETP